MASGVYVWSQTASSNGNADTAINFLEGQTPGSLNDSNRSMMAVLKKHDDDITGAIVTGGTSTAYTAASYSSFDSLAHLNGQIIAFTPHATNGATVTLNVDGLGAKPLRPFPGVELQSNSLIAGTPYVALYNSSDAVFYLRGNAGGTYGVPLGGGMHYFGTTAPSSAFVFPAGQAISRTTYATCFSLFGTTYGTGDGSTTFNVPDLTGRVLAVKEATATRLTTAGGGVDGGTLGAVGGAQKRTLAANQIPAGVPSSGSNVIVVTSDNGNIVHDPGIQSSNAAGGSNKQLSASASAIAETSRGTNSIAVTSTNAGQQDLITVQPTLVANFILRVL
jgi:microcystin-dependent protein